MDAPTHPCPDPPLAHLGGGHLTVDDVVRVAREQGRVAPLGIDATARMMATADWVRQMTNQLGDRLSSPRAFYGVNTGFGAQAGRSALASRYLAEVLGRNLITSHAVGVGPYFDEEVVRAAMLIRAQSLAQGYSGVRPLVVGTLVAMLNTDVYPAVPEQGSLGASGDLAPLAHLMLSMSSPPMPGPDDVDLGIDQSDGEAFVRHMGHDPVGGDAFLHLSESYGSGQQSLWRRVPGAQAMSGIGGKIRCKRRRRWRCSMARLCQPPLARWSSGTH